MRPMALCAFAIVVGTGQAASAASLPPNPVAGESFVLSGQLTFAGAPGLAPNTYCTLHRVGLSVEGTSIVIVPEIDGSTSFVLGAKSACPFTVPVPGLPMGSYSASLRYQNLNGPPIATLSANAVTVAASPPPAVPAYRNLSGNWFDPSDPGWGVNVVQGDSGAVFALWLSYQGPENSVSGQFLPPVWVVMPSARWLSPTHVRGLLYKTGGSGFNVEFDPSKSTVNAAGYLSLEFTSDHEALLEGTFLSTDGAALTPVSKQVAVRRLEF
jgi:hypothetical protein